ITSDRGIPFRRFKKCNLLHCNMHALYLYKKFSYTVAYISVLLYTIPVDCFCQLILMALINLSHLLILIFSYVKGGEFHVNLFECRENFKSNWRRNKIKNHFLFDD